MGVQLKVVLRGELRDVIVRKRMKTGELVQEVIKDLTPEQVPEAIARLLSNSPTLSP